MEIDNPNSIHAFNHFEEEGHTERRYNLHKRCNKTETKKDAKGNTKTGSKVEYKKGAKAGANIASKAPRSGYYLFLREQLEKMTGEDWKN